MTKSLPVSALVVTLLLSTTPASAAGPLTDSVARAAQASASSPSAIGADATPHGEALFWSGIALLGAGAAVEILSYSALRTESVVGCGLYLCLEKSTNTGVMATGAAIALTGMVMQTIGWKQMRPMITFGPRPSVGVRVGFK